MKVNLIRLEKLSFEVYYLFSPWHYYRLLAVK